MNNRFPSRVLQTSFSSLKHRNFRLFWLGQCVSLIGTWMQNIGQSWLVLQLTHSPLKLSIVTMIQFLPMMLFSLYAGTLIDRFSKRKILIFTQISMLLLATALATLTYFNVVQYWHVLILALLLGIVNTIDMPTRQSFFVELVGKEDLMNAIALNSSIFNLARIIGPAIAGILIGLVGIAICFYLNALSFVAVIIGIWMIKVPAQVKSEHRFGSIKEINSDVAEGLRYINSKLIIKVPLLLLALLSLFVMNYNVLLPIFAETTPRTRRSRLWFSDGDHGSRFIHRCDELGNQESFRTEFEIFGCRCTRCFIVYVDTGITSEFHFIIDHLVYYRSLFDHLYGPGQFDHPVKFSRSYARTRNECLFAGVRRCRSDRQFICRNGHRVLRCSGMHDHQRRYRNRCDSLCYLCIKKA